ncbi:MAG: hypothetical protein IPL40_11565 [Proteobacteria bacterium]|nr:hypothetical protein [Pseudomonadota bacterium]
MATRNRIAPAHRPPIGQLIRQRRAFTAAGAALALALLAASPAWGAAPAAAVLGASTTGTRTPVSTQVSRLVTGLVTRAAGGLAQARARFVVRKNAGEELRRSGRAGLVTGERSVAPEEALAAALVAHGATPQAAARAAWKTVARAGRAALPVLKNDLRSAAAALRGASKGSQAAESEVDRPGERFLDALWSYASQAGDLGHSSWGALRFRDAVGVRRTVAQSHKALDGHLVDAVAAQDPAKIAAALGVAAAFRKITADQLGSVEIHRPGARFLSPKGHGQPLVEAAQHAFGVDRVLSAIEATREGELKGHFTNQLANGTATLDRLLGDGRGLCEVAVWLEPRLRGLDDTHTQTLTGKALKAHYRFGGGQRRMNKVIEEIAPRALRAMLQGLVLRATRLKPAEAALIAPLMLEAMFYEMPRALKKELQQLREQVRLLGVEEEAAVVAAEASAAQS